MANTDAEKLKALKELKKRVEGAKVDTATIKAAKAKGDALKTSTKAEAD